MNLYIEKLDQIISLFLEKNIYDAILPQFLIKLYKSLIMAVYPVGVCVGGFQSTVCITRREVRLPSQMGYVG